MSHRERSDAELVEGIRAGDEACFEALHARYRQRVFAFALKRLGDPCEAEDVTQEVFLQIFRSIGSYEGRSRLLTWIFGITHNQVCRRFRKTQPIRVSMDEPEAECLAAPEPPADHRVDVQRMLDRCASVSETELSAGQRRVFDLRFRENCSTRAIARRLGKSPQAVKISLFRARRTMARHAPDVPALLSA